MIPRGKVDDAQIGNAQIRGAASGKLGHAFPCGLMIQRRRKDLACLRQKAHTPLRFFSLRPGKHFLLS